MKLTTIALILAVTMPEWVRAAVIGTAQSGDWSAPASWTGGAYPDTYSGDSAMINTGHTINYNDIGGGIGSMSTPAAPGGAGGFAIANGNTVTIDGGTLTQTTLTQKMRIGEGTGATSGNGTLIIQNGGVLNTGASIGLEVGTSIGGGGGGNGDLYISSGALNAGGYITVGASGGVGQVHQTGGAVTFVQSVFMGVGSGPSGTSWAVSGGSISGGGGFEVGSDRAAVMSISGTASIAVGSYSVGVRLGSNALAEMSGGTLTVGGELNVGGAQSAGTGSLTVSGGRVTTGGATYIGRHGGTGVLSVLSGGAVTGNGETFFGEGSGSSGVISVDAGGTLTINQFLNVGRNGGEGTVSQAGGIIGVQQEARFGYRFGGEAGGTGLFDLSGGAFTSGGSTVIGHGAGSTGTLNLSGTGALTAGGQFQLGDGLGLGEANMAGGTLRANGAIGIGRDGGTGTFNLSSGTLTKGTSGSTGTFDIGVSPNGATPGSGALYQTGGTIINTVADTNVARDNGSIGFWNMVAGNANLLALSVGNGGNGTLSMTSGNINVTGRVFVAAAGGSAGTINLNGGVLTAQYLEAGAGTVSLSMNGGTLRANANENNYLRNFNPANSEIASGGVIFDTNTYDVRAINQLDGTGVLTKTGNGTLFLTAANLYTGGTVINAGVLNINTNAALGGVAGGVAINNNATLQASANVTANRVVTLGAGGGRIDTNGQVITLDTASTLAGTSLTEADTLGGGVLNIKGTQTYSALTTTGGVTNIYTALGTGTSTITANATTNIYARQRLAALSIGAGVEVTFGDGLPLASDPVKFSGPFGGGEVTGLVPEPGSLSLLMCGALGFLARRQRNELSD